MMPAIARSSGQDRVFSLTGSGKGCGRPFYTTTGTPTCEVYVNGVKVVRKGDQVALHLAGGCGPDLSSLTTASSTVFVGGQGIGRIGDVYTSDNTIISGSSTVFCS